MIPGVPDPELMLCHKGYLQLEDQRDQATVGHIVPTLVPPDLGFANNSFSNNSFPSPELVRTQDMPPRESSCQRVELEQLKGE